ncbi:MAG: PH domain-containing protein, partial [Acidimicrobiia bacterium]|nr:PH domain-containing protein [Acidimicrobiia bacterium]
MPFPKEMLNQGEELLLDLRPHWWYIAPSAALLGAAAILAVVVLTATDNGPVRVLVGLLLLLALGGFVVRYVRWAGINFVVTSGRVISRTGVIAKKGIEIPLDRINTVFFNQGLFERLIGAGDLGIESAGEGGRQTFEDIRKPREVQQEIYRAMEADERSRFEAMGQAASGARDPQPASIAEEIAQFDELR